MIVLVGARANGHELRAYRWRVHGLATRLAVGAFRIGRAAAHLVDLGACWHVAFNLLPAIPLGEASWSLRDREDAALVAAQAQGEHAPWAAPHAAELLLCGPRVAQAFGLEYVPFRAAPFAGQSTLSMQRRRLVMLPDPTPADPWWREQWHLEDARQWFTAMRARHNIPRLRRPIRGLIP